MSLRVISVLVLLSTIIVFTLFLLFTHLSTWFIWELLPPGAVQIAVNQTHPAANFLTDYLSATGLASTLEQLKSTRRFSISAKPNSTTVVVVPNNPLLFRNHQALINQLSNAGFHTQRFGLLIIARQNNGTDDIVHTKFFPAFRQTIRRLFSNTLPAKPLLIASIESGIIPFLENPLTLLGTARGNSVQLVAAEPTIDFHSISQNTPSPPQQENELTLTTPSHVITTLPEPLRHEWNKILISKLGFANTQPDILTHLSQYNSPINIKLTQNGAVITVAKTQKAFSNTVKTWVQAEEAHFRQQQQAFRLPDGTFGYELAPGDTREVFTNSLSSENCRQDAFPLPGKEMHYLWLCSSDTWTAFGSDEKATREAIQQPIMVANSWNISIGTQYLTSLSLSGIKSISAAGTDTQAIIHINLQ